MMVLLAQNSYQTQAELKPRDVERRFFAFKRLLQRQNRKGFSHRIVTGDQKWVHYDNTKRKKSWGLPGHASSLTARLNIYDAKIMLCILWDQLGMVYYELFAETEWNHHWGRYGTQLMHLSWALEEKTATVLRETPQSCPPA